MSEEPRPKRSFHDWEIALAAVSSLLILIIVFATGILVGFEKAKFSYSWGENYYQNVMGPRPPFPGNRFIDARGSAGQIVKIDNNNIVVRDKDGSEKTIIVSNSTAIKKGVQDVNIKDLKVDDDIIVLGAPNQQGEIDAKLIRVTGDIIQ